MYDNDIRHTNNAPAVVARGLGKQYGDLWALRGLDLDVPEGTVLGLLGHNGAGKTTAIRILTTLARATEGTAAVAGHDVATAGELVRGSIGVAAQDATVDGLLTARKNLELLGRLYHLPRRRARARADELLELLDLADAATRLAGDLSGGMRRRLDLAAAMIAEPRVLFLDEPTTGLDPRSRNDLWGMLRDLVDGGTTLVLTTQYLEEADRLADEIVLLDHGVVAASGSPADLKARIGGERIVVTVADAAELDRAARTLEPFLDGAASGDEETCDLVAPVVAGTRLLDVVRALDAAGIDALDAHRREPTLDDVFLTLTAPRERSAA